MENQFSIKPILLIGRNFQNNDLKNWKFSHYVYIDNIQCVIFRNKKLHKIAS